MQQIHPGAALQISIAAQSLATAHDLTRADEMRLRSTGATTYQQSRCIGAALATMRSAAARIREARDNPSPPELPAWPRGLGRRQGVA